MSSRSTIQILGINFYQKGSATLLRELEERGGLLVAPAAPALVNLPSDPFYREALEKSDFAIADSAFMAYVWNLTHAEKVNKLSGYRFLTDFLQQKVFSASAQKMQEFFWVMPDQFSVTHTQKFFKTRYNLSLADKNTYVAPHYGQFEVVDANLLQRIESLKPKFIIINIGGGTQERLGYFLKEKLSYMPAILCTGAALFFITGYQAKIPFWMDSLGLGWLARCWREPKKFISRYIKAWKLLPMILRSRDK
jgi:N-acetylglucosaminyldiphosphoundecaprenol N-acetyl-beta-D-mannosaminyltransferase